MSIINNMLKNLDRRKANDTSSQGPNFQGIKVLPFSARNSFKHRRLFLLIASGLMLGLLISLQQRIASHIPTLSTAQMLKLPMPTAFNNVSGVKFQPPAKNTLQQWQTYNGSESSTLQLALQSPAIFRVKQPSDNRHLVIILEDTKLNPTFKTTSPLPVALANLHMAQVKDDLEIYLDLKPGSQLQDLRAIHTPFKGVEIKFIHRSETTSEENTQQANSLAAQLSAAASVKANSTHESSPAVYTESDVASAQTRYDRALAFINMHENDKGIAILEELLQASPTHKLAREKLAALKLAEGNIAQAMQLYSDGLHLSPNYVSFIKGKAQCLMKQQQYADALKLLERAPSSAMADNEYLGLLAEAFQETGNAPRAATLYSRLVEMAPQNGVWWMGYGISLEKLNQPMGAKTAYRRALEDNDINAASRLFLTERLSQLANAG